MGDRQWRIESHEFRSRIIFQLQAAPDQQKVNTASSKSNLSIIGEGDVSLTVWNGGGYQTVLLKECLHVAGLSKNLFSVPSAVAKGVNVSMNQKQCIISVSNKTVALGAKVGNLNYIKT